jgi:hypothetical protein
MHVSEALLQQQQQLQSARQQAYEQQVQFRKALQQGQELLQKASTWPRPPPKPKEAKHVAGRTDKTKNESALEEGQDFLDELLVQQIELQVQIQEQIQLPLFLKEEMIHAAAGNA